MWSISINIYMQILTYEMFDLFRWIFSKLYIFYNLSLLTSATGKIVKKLKIEIKKLYIENTKI
jgi:hypothetical protein